MVINLKYQRNELPKIFYLKLPEIYQIEITTNCNLNCDMCTRGQYKRKTEYIDVDLVKKISKRDLGGSYFVELQMMGEPLLHSNLGEIIDILSKKVNIGLSTNGLLIDKKLEDICKLDYLTINMNAMKNYNDIQLLLNKSKHPKIDLQLVEVGDWKNKYNIIKSLIDKNKWDVVLRTVPDCFLVTRGNKDERKIKKELCLNPYLSVSVQVDGDVVPCCFAWDKEIVYGNLNNDSLKKIWSNNIVKDMRKRHESKSNYYDICKKCYMRSPTILHQNILKNWFRK